MGVRADAAGVARVEGVGGAPRLAVEHLGGGPLVVFLHGIGGNRHNWRGQLAVCAREGFHAAAWDARGYGDSDDYEGPLDFADFAHDLARTLDHFGAPRAHLVGLSMGGRIALDFHEHYRARVASLVLCSTFPGFAASFTAAEREAFVARRRDPLLAGRSPRDIAPELARTLLGPHASPAHFAHVIESLSALHKASYIKAVEATARYERVAALPGVAAPTLLLYGSADRLTPPAIGKRMAAAMAQARLEVIEGAGHLLNIEYPETFNDLLLDFLRAQPPPAGSA